MSRLFAHIDDERRAPSAKHAARALVRPPLCEPEGESGLYVIADIRLDNRRELRESLGIEERDKVSDTALIAQGFGRFGARLFSKLVGAFAIVIWDSRERRLVAARDPMGERPLYYRAEGSRFYLASSVEQLLTTFDTVPEIEDETVFGFLGGEYGRLSSTFFRGIHRLPPGSFLVASQGNEPRIQRYWHPPETFLRLPRTEDYHLRFRELLEEAVRARLDSDGPILAHLSGGLDSSSIACIADRLYRESSVARPPLRLVSGLYPGLDCDESRFIREISKASQLPWESFDATAFDFTDLERPFLDWPGGRSSQAGYPGDLAIARRVEARVLISGFGGDDVGSEAGIFRDLAAMGRLGTLLRETLLVREFHAGSRRRMLIDGLKGLLPHSLHDAYLKHRPRRSTHPPAWLGPSLRALWPGPRPEASEPEEPWLSHGQRWLFRAFTNANRAWCSDLEARQAAEVSVEVRYPFFDIRLANFVLAIPPEHRLPGGSYRVLQRKAMRALVPQSILDRHEATTFEAAFLARARAGLSRYRALFEEGQWLSGAYAERGEILRICRQLEGTRSPEQHFTAFRAVENVALLEAWLRALRTNHGRPW